MLEFIFITVFYNIFLITNITLRSSHGQCMVFYLHHHCWKSGYLVLVCEPASEITQFQCRELGTVESESGLATVRSSISDCLCWLHFTVSSATDDTVRLSNCHTEVIPVLSF